MIQNVEYKEWITKEIMRSDSATIPKISGALWNICVSDKRRNKTNSINKHMKREREMQTFVIQLVRWTSRVIVICWIKYKMCFHSTIEWHALTMAGCEKSNSSCPLNWVSSDFHRVRTHYVRSSQRHHFKLVEILLRVNTNKRHGFWRRRRR